MYYDELDDLEREVIQIERATRRFDLDEADERESEGDDEE